MYQISCAIYENMANHLIDKVGKSSYFSGTVEFSTIDNQGCEVECRIVASLIIYRETISLPEGCVEVISNIVPVWLECHTIVEMEERINDFDIVELKNYICVW